MSESMHVEASTSEDTVPDPTLTQRALNYLLAAIDKRNAEGGEIIDEETKKHLVDAYHITCREEKEFFLTTTLEEVLAYMELLRESIIIAEKAAEFLRNTRQIVRQACEARGMPEEEIVKRLRYDLDNQPVDLSNSEVVVDPECSLDLRNTMSPSDVK